MPKKEYLCAHRYLLGKDQSMQLVTGGGGFIGSHLVRTLVQRGDAVRVLDNGLTGSRERIADVLADVERIEGDIRDGDKLRRACRGGEGVFHQAAGPSVPRTIAEPAGGGRAVRGGQGDERGHGRECDAQSAHRRVGADSWAADRAGLRGPTSWRRAREPGRYFAAARDAGLGAGDLVA